MSAFETMSARPKTKSKQKAVPKKKKTGKTRSDSKFATTEKVKKWIKEESKLKCHQLKSTTDPIKNYYCGVCDAFRSATCKNDVFKHVDPKKFSFVCCVFNCYIFTSLFAN